jgi:hypothetical protein
MTLLVSWLRPYPDILVLQHNRYRDRGEERIESGNGPAGQHLHAQLLLPNVMRLMSRLDVHVLSGPGSDQVLLSGAEDCVGR